MRDQLFMATKVWTNGRDEGIRQMETSFKRLRVERMDLMQVHNLADVATHTETLKEWKQKKRIRYIGITHYTSSAYGEVERWLKTKQHDFLQINYSLGEREAENRLLPMALDLKVAVIANRPFAEGALFRRVKGKPLPPWAAELGIGSWAQYFLKWIVSHPAITCAIPGTGNPKHMADNLGAGGGQLPTRSKEQTHGGVFRCTRLIFRAGGLWPRPAVRRSRVGCHGSPRRRTAPRDRSRRGRSRRVASGCRSSASARR